MCLLCALLLSRFTAVGFSFRTASRARLLPLAGYPEWFKAAPPMRFELRGLLAAGLKQKRIHGLS